MRSDQHSGPQTSHVLSATLSYPVQENLALERKPDDLMMVMDLATMEEVVVWAFAASVISSPSHGSPWMPVVVAVNVVGAAVETQTNTWLAACHQLQPKYL